MPTKITAKDVAKIGNSTRLFKDVSNVNVDSIRNELLLIMEHIDNLSNVDTEDYYEYSTMKMVKIDDLRNDSFEDSEEYQRVRKNIINNFPQKQDNFLQLPIRIVEDN